jgi:hypothetical protein
MWRPKCCRSGLRPARLPTLPAARGTSGLSVPLGPQRTVTGSTPSPPSWSRRGGAAVSDSDVRVRVALKPGPLKPGPLTRRSGFSVGRLESRWHRHTSDSV